MQVVINKCYGGFSISLAACVWIADHYPGFFSIDELNHIEKQGSYSYYGKPDIGFRSSEPLVQVVKELGDEAAGDYARLKIVTIPDDIEAYIDEYDGIESIHEVHRTWE